MSDHTTSAHGTATSVPRGGATGALVAVLALLSFVEPLGTDIYLPAFPRMTEELAASPTQIQLTLTMFLVGLAAGHLVFGPLSDRIGRRVPLLVGTAATAAAGAACALAPSVEWLVAFRLVQGIAAASGLVIARSIVSDVAEGPQAARLFGLLMGLLGVAPIAAPLLGGALLGVGSWRTVFWVLTALMAALVVAVLATVPETLPPQRREAQSAASTRAAVLAVLSNRAYLGWTLAFSCTFGALFCYIAGSSFLYQEAFGLGVAGNAWAVAITVLIHSLTALCANRVVDVRPQRLVVVGLAAMVVAALSLLGLALTGLLVLPAALGALAVFFVGTGLVMPNATAAAFDSLTGSTGTGSAVLGALQNGVAALAAPAVGVLGGDITVALTAGMAGFTVLAVAAIALTRTRRPAAEHSTTDRTASSGPADTPTPAGALRGLVPGRADDTTDRKARKCPSH